MIGASAAAIDMAEDRELFREAMQEIGLETPKSILAHSLSQALDAIDELGLTVSISHTFPVGGTGGGSDYPSEELINMMERGTEAVQRTAVSIE